MDAANVGDARGLSFRCLPGCGFCCTAAPLVLPSEAGPLGSLVTRTADGTLRIPLKGLACTNLQEDARCGAYDARPSVCRVYPYQVHAGRRVQAVVTLACPGVMGGAAPDAVDMEQGARDVATRVLAAPGAREMAAQAKETFLEYDRRMREWGVPSPPDKLRAAFLPHVDRLARPVLLPTFFAGLEPGDLLLDGKAHLAVEALFETEAETGVEDLLAQAAEDAFGDNGDVLWVEPDLAWALPRFRDGRIRLQRQDRAGTPREATFDPADLPTDWTEAASGVLARYLARLLHRDHTEGAAAWLVDASGYQATPAAAYGRVVGEASLQVVLRAGLFAAEAGVDEIDEPLAARGIAAYETSYHSLPTLGSIL